MALQHEKSSEQKSSITAANTDSGVSAVQLKDNRMQSVVQKKLSNTSSEPIQKKENKTGLPDHLKAGMENLSNQSLDHVKVHYNSSKPAKVQALAYAQGSNIHVGPGQEKHLPHELGHVVQQMEGRVKPNISVDGMPVNNDPGLEQEATNMGNQAIQRATSSSQINTAPVQAKKSNPDYTAQFQSMDQLGIPGVNYAVMSQKNYSQWQQTAQAKFISGVHHNGDQVVVTQFQEEEEQQQQSFFSLPSTITGSLVIAEGLLSFAASIAFFALPGENNLLAGLMALGVAASKVVRGAYTIKDGKKPSREYKILIDLLRGFESGLALAVGIETRNKPGIVFAVAKLLRSLLHGLMDYLGKDNPSITYKISSVIASVLHWIEVAAVATSGGMNVGDKDKAKDITGGLNIGVAISKGVRSGFQSKSAYEAVNSPEQPNEHSALLNNPV